MRFSGANVLVTGGLGFVGSRLARALEAEGAQVTILDNGFNGAPASVAGLSARIVTGSVTDAALVRALVQPADLVFHLAARSIIQSMKSPMADIEANLSGTLQVLAALKERPAGGCRLIYTSSASVYGNARHLPAGEEEPYSLLTPYAASKLAGEHFCETFYEAYGVPSAILRYSNVYGPGQTARNPYCGVLGLFIERALRGEPLLIHGDGEQTRDFTYVDDAVEATLLAALAPAAVGEVFNVGTGTEVSLNNVAQLIREATGSAGSIQHVPRRDIDTIRRRAVQIEKARRRLRWSPKVSLPEGISRTVEAYRGEASTRALPEVSLAEGST
ncbi:MAG TPA: NAD-dependent epimerase/dehydratase family protein [Symbiobacteriaceae bacterium]|nr:NAD-dependent epimerase/dehydratase family protein [Symbiobacteriaceae bacterium]